MSTPCRYFAAGNCKHGDHCRYAHVTSSGTPSAEPSRQPCKYFAAGHCRDGDKCRFPHVRPAESRLLGATGEELAQNPDALDSSQGEGRDALSRSLESLPQEDSSKPAPVNDLAIPRPPTPPSVSTIGLDEPGISNVLPSGGLLAGSSCLGDHPQEENSESPKTPPRPPSSDDDLEAQKTSLDGSDARWAGAASAAAAPKGSAKPWSGIVPVANASAQVVPQHEITDPSRFAPPTKLRTRKKVLEVSVSGIWCCNILMVGVVLFRYCLSSSIPD